MVAALGFSNFPLAFFTLLSRTRSSETSLPSSTDCHRWLLDIFILVAMWTWQGQGHIDEGLLLMTEFVVGRKKPQNRASLPGTEVLTPRQ